MAENKKIKSQKVRVAIFGAGKMAMNHINAISQQPDADLVAISDPEIDKINNEWPKNISTFSNSIELLEKELPDIVHICSPPQSHYELTSLALRYGANVYVEKPFALTVKDAKEIISLAERSGLRVCAGHQLLFQETTNNAEKNIYKIGRIVHVESYFSFNPVRGSWEGRGRIPPLDQLIDILPHPIYLLLHFIKYNQDKNIIPSVKMEALHVRCRGTIFSIFHNKEVTGNLHVTLEGRPIESYLKIVGTNGAVYSDYVRGTTTVLAGPGTSSISKVINPYSQSWQIFAGTTRSLLNRVFRKQNNYPGLVEIIKNFYNDVIYEKPMDSKYEAIIEVVTFCEEITHRLREAESDEAKKGENEPLRAGSSIHSVDSIQKGILVTGGTGFLGNAVCGELIRAGFRTRVISRCLPLASKKIPGVEYFAVDLENDIPIEILDGISTVVHCAAETFGGIEAHERNSVKSTKNIILAMKRASVNRFIHISSIAVLMTSGEIGRPIDENTALVPENEKRGPYVWGKVKSENLARTMCDKLGIAIRVIRPGALVNYNNFEPPGRLGREIGPLFICVGNQNRRVGICDVDKAAKVIGLYVADFNNMPESLNLIDPDSPTNAGLVSILLKNRPDLKVIYIPITILRIMSPGLKLLQKVLRPKITPIDIYSVFATEIYNNDQMVKILRRIDSNIE